MVTLQQALYRIVHSIDPAAKVLNPPPTTLLYGGAAWFDSFLAAGGLHQFDVAGCHLYTWPDSPETWSFGNPGNLGAFKQVLAKYGIASLDIWNTESGWNTTVGDATMAAYVARMYILGWANGVKRYYFYAWDDNNMGVLTGTTVRLPGLAMGRLHDWLVGAALPSCSVSGTVYSCPLTRSGGYQGWLVWDTAGASSFALPAGAKTSRALDGTSASLAGQTSTPIGISPVLIQNQ
jgi:hypothetical protein